MPDGGGLYLQVGGAGAASWIFRYTVNGKQRWMGLGPYVDVSLAQARELARECRVLRRAGIDPIAEKQSVRATERRSAAKQRTFKSLANEYIEAREHKWSAKHSAQWAATLETYAYPIIGNVPVGSIGIDQVVEILKPIWHSKEETARRVRGRIEKVLDEAQALELREGENPAALSPRMKKLLQDDLQQKRPVHLAALPYQQINQFVTDLREKTEVARLALEFTILTAARTGEVIAATKSEIAGDIWTIPADRMKSGFSHRVPLSQAALDVLERLPEFEGKWLFPGHKAGSHLSNMAMLTLLKKRMSWPGITVHGFRSTFRDWVADQTTYANVVAEKALAHSVGDKTEAAYRRNDMLQRRRPMMEDWARYVNSKKGSVVSMPGKAASNE